MSATRTILITGGAGFIGARLAVELSRNHRVVVYDSFHPQAHHDPMATRLRMAQQGVEVHAGDLRDLAALQAVFAKAKPDIVYHLAAETGTGQSFDHPLRYCDVNVTGTANLVQAMRQSVIRPARIVLAGSRAVYGEGAYVDADGLPAGPQQRSPGDLAAGRFLPRDGNGLLLVPMPTRAGCPVAPASVYAATKLMQEHLLRHAFWGTDTGVGILRLQNIYGPGQSLHNPYTGVLSIFCRQLQDGHALDIHEDGQITRDFLFVDDAVRAFIRIGLIACLPDETIDIGSGQGITIHDVARRLAVLTGRSEDALQITGTYRPGDIRHSVADIRRAADLLGWTPEVSLDAGLRALVHWSSTHRRGFAVHAAE
jgi:dTDP-L-rhamnose 4-epimerase